MKIINCLQCNKKIKIPNKYLIVPYATSKNNNKICSSCSADIIKKEMRNNKRITLYLDINKKIITDFLGKLIFPINNYIEEDHNTIGYRVTVWFSFENKKWWGVLYGRNTQSIHCKQYKG